MENIKEIEPTKIADGLPPRPRTEPDPPRSMAVAMRGIKTSGDFSELMSALMSDIIESRVTPSVGNATVNAGGKLLKMVEMQLKYGTSKPGDSIKMIELVPMAV